MQRTAVETKDHILDLITVEDQKTFLQNAKNVLLALQMQQGLWAELGYAYKGEEIARDIRYRCVNILQDCRHAMTIKSVTVLQEQAIKMQQEFFVLNQERRY